MTFRNVGRTAYIVERTGRTGISYRIERIYRRVVYDRPGQRVKTMGPRIVPKQLKGPYVRIGLESWYEKPIKGKRILVEEVDYLFDAYLNAKRYTKGKYNEKNYKSSRHSYGTGTRPSFNYWLQ